MGWIVAGALAAAALLLLIVVLKAPRRTWEALAAALVFGLAGFARQASTDQPGAPKAAAAVAVEGGEALVRLRLADQAGG